MIALVKVGLLLSGLALFASGALAQQTTQAQDPPPQTPPQPSAPKTLPTPPQQPPAPPPPPQPKAAPSDNTDLATGDGAFSIQPFYWITRAEPVMRGGKAKTTAESGNLDFPGKSKYTPGAVLSIPLKESTIRISYFRTTGKGSTTAASDLNLFSTGFDSGDFLTTSYRLENVKISLDYLSYPFPVHGSKFRFKTLWEIQYTTINSKVNAPLKVDSTGAAAPVTVSAKKSIIYPTFGLGVERSFGKHFRVEAKGSGFAIPRGSTIWDADGALAFRAGHIEVLVGGKAYHFKTSPKKDEYVLGTLSGGYIGLRYYLK